MITDRKMITDNNDYTPATNTVHTKALICYQILSYVDNLMQVVKKNNYIFH